MPRDAEVAAGIASWRDGRTASSRAGMPGAARYFGAAACRALRAEAHRARRCRQSTAPLPSAGSHPRNAPAATASAPTGRDQPGNAGRADRRANGHSARAGTPRIVQAGPSSINGASHPATRDACGAPLTPEPLPARRAWRHGAGQRPAPESAQRPSVSGVNDSLALDWRWPDRRACHTRAERPGYSGHSGALAD